MTQQKGSSQQVRIIGGKWRGQKLRFSGDASLRPTLGRTRETLFNWLRPVIREARCLDAFAGSGILGFEALSLGAASAVFIDQNPQTTRSLAASAEKLNAQTQCEVIKTDFFAYLRRTTATFDIVFLDPPFSQPQLLNQALTQLNQNPTPAEYIYAESKSLEVLTWAAQSTGWAIYKQTQTGNTTGALLTPDLQHGDTKDKIRVRNNT